MEKSAEELKLEVANLQEENEVLQKENEILKNTHESFYITDGSLPRWERHDDSAQKEHVKSKWTVEKKCSAPTMCGNIRVNFHANVASLMDTIDSYRSSSTVASHQQISSALALYRSISLFECGLRGKEDFYKQNWTVVLKHKKTGVCLSLGEWKGGFQIFTPYLSIEEVNPEFKTDAEELLTLLVSPTLTIGYDGTVAGCVA